MLTSQEGLPEILGRVLEASLKLFVPLARTFNPAKPFHINRRVQGGEWGSLKEMAHSVKTIHELP